MELQMVIATHKEAQFPTKQGYLPVQVGAAFGGDICRVKDNTGDNISQKNKSYCELTAVYWAWKNLQADAVGLCHYRRFFVERSVGNVIRNAASEHLLQAKLQTAPVILPRKRHYWIETNYSQYVHAHHTQDLTLTRQILAEKYPEYLDAYDRTMSKTRGHRFNMFVMQRDFFCSYCGWLFDILFTLESRLDTSDYSAYDRRVFGFVAERLLDVWIEANRIPYCELPIRNTEKEHWCKKIFKFIYRKLCSGRL